MDCTINGSTREIEEASSKLFALCRKIVSAQKGVNVDGLLNNEAAPTASGPTPPATAPAAPAAPPAGPSAPNSNGTPKLASAKQIRYVLELAKKAGMSTPDIQNLPATYKKARPSKHSLQLRHQGLSSLSPRKKPRNLHPLFLIPVFFQFHQFNLLQHVIPLPLPFSSKGEYPYGHSSQKSFVFDGITVRQLFRARLDGENRAGS